MSRLRIVHRTGFSYEQPATASYNEARMLPHSGGEQFVLQAGLDIRPRRDAALVPRLLGHARVDVRGAHAAPRAVGHGDEPRRGAPGARARHASSTGTSCAGAALDTVTLVEASTLSAATTPPPEVAALAGEIAAEGAPVGETALEICRAVGSAHGVHARRHRRALHRRRGVGASARASARTSRTSRSAPCARSASRRATCRATCTPTPGAAIGETVIGESHAWVEWFAGEWRGYDPTNLVEVGDRHVLVGRGRDYSDVSPLRGVYAGPSASELFVTVEITRVA